MVGKVKQNCSKFLIFANPIIVGMTLLEFFIDISFRPHYGPGVDSASNRNEYQEYFLGSKGGRCIQLTTLPISCADWLEIWRTQPPELSGPVQACNETAVPFSILVNHIMRKYGTNSTCLK